MITNSSLPSPEMKILAGSEGKLFQDHLMHQLIIETHMEGGELVLCS